MQLRLSVLIAFLLAGTLADHVFEPLLADASGALGSIIGSGPGRGIGLMYVLAGLFTMVIVAVAWNLPSIRNLETEVPDLAPATGAV